MNIRIAGFGGQGIIMAGYALGHAGILDGGNALQTQSYGSESRGGACKSDVIISDEEILELAPSVLDVLVAMSQPALDRYAADLKDDGTLIYDSELVKLTDAQVLATSTSERGAPRMKARKHLPGTEGPLGNGGIRAFGLPATDLAHQKFGRDIVANMIMLGYLAGLIDVVSGDSLRRAISESVPPKTVEMNLQAFEEGLTRGRQRQ